jgi:riboflavin kinase / FMN adenylyltransferase
LDRYALRELVIGHDHGLGRGREGDAAALRAIGAELGFPVDVVPPTTSPEGVPISSSAIRKAVAEGRLDTAAKGLGRRYAFRGSVVPGSQRGRELGFPTVNLALVSSEKQLPPLGVYAVRVTFSAGTFGGMLNLGGRPTFGDFVLSPEVHLFDVAGDWYGQSLRVEFVARLRDTIRFGGVEALREQLTKDAATARSALTQL